MGFEFVLENMTRAAPKAAAIAVPIETIMPIIVAAGKLSP